MNQATLANIKFSSVDQDFNEYEYNINNIHKAYANCFDLDIGLPSTTIEIGKEFKLPLKAFMAWRALISSYYYCEILPDIEFASYTLSYYDKYELPTCYRVIKFSFLEITLMSKVANFDVRFNTSSIKEIIKEYLQVLGFIRKVITTPNYSKLYLTKEWYNKIKAFIKVFINKFK